MRIKQRGIIPIVGVVIAFVVLVVGGGTVYYFGKTNKLKEEGKTATETQTEESTTPQVQVTKVPQQKGGSSSPSTPATTNKLSDWQEYKNERFPYKIKYPPGWYFLKTGYSPPPPVGVMFSNLPGGYQPGTNSASADIFVLPTDEKTIEEIGEVKNLVEEQYYKKTEIRVSGERALRLEVPDKSETNFSVYLLHKGNSYRIGFAETSIDKPQFSETFEKILSSFTFTD